MKIYINTIPATLANAMQALKEQDALMKTVHLNGTILAREDGNLVYISGEKNGSDSIEIDIDGEDGACCIDWHYEEGYVDVGDGIEVFYQFRTRPECTPVEGKGAEGFVF